MGGHVEVGTGRGRHVQFHAGASGVGRPAQKLRFRFSDLVRFHHELAVFPDLGDILLPPLPPKVTVRSVFLGNRNMSFQEERQVHIQQFFDDLANILTTKYAELGDFVDLCEPFSEFLSRAARLSDEADAAEVRAAVAAAQIAEDHDLMALQDQEYHDALRIDQEAAAAAEAESKEAERQEEEKRKEAERAEEAARTEMKKLEERRADLQGRRSAFEEAYPPPQPNEPQVMVRLRTKAGATLTRSLPADAIVDALFELAVVADWSAPQDKFDLRIPYPVRSLQEFRQQTLREAGLFPSAVLLVADLEDDS